MNDMTPASTALALPAASDLAAIFKADRGIDPIIAKIEEAARSEAAGLTADTAKGRDALKSLAHKVSQTKAELDRQGKALTEVQRREIDAVNKGRRIAEERLAALRDEVRKPVTDWEEADAARKARVEAVLAGMRAHGMGAESTSTEIAAKAADIKALAFDADFADQLEQAEMVRETALSSLRTLYAAAKTREDQEAELAALRAEKAERERIEAERITKEKEEQFRREQAELAEAQKQAEEHRRIQEAKKARESLANGLIRHIRAAANGMIDGQPYPIAMLMHEVKVRVLRDANGCGDLWINVEAERQKAIIALEALKAEEDERVEKGRKEAAERAQAEAERAVKEQAERAQREAAEREAALQRQLAAETARAEAAAQAERDRIAAEQKAEADARAKREADAAHRQRICDEITQALIAMSGASPIQIAAALMAGQIPHCEVRI